MSVICTVGVNNF